MGLVDGTDTMGEAWLSSNKDGDPHYQAWPDVQAHAVNLFAATGKRTMLHYHLKGQDCRLNVCTLWPNPAPNPEVMLTLLEAIGVTLTGFARRNPRTGPAVLEVADFDGIKTTFPQLFQRGQHNGH